MLRRSSPFRFEITSCYLPKNKSLRGEFGFFSWAAKLHCEACDLFLERGKTWIMVRKIWAVRHENQKEDFADFSHTFWVCSEKCQVQLVLKEM